MFSFVLNFYDVHCVSYIPRCMSCIYIRFEYLELTLIFLIARVCSLFNLKRSARLPHIFQWQSIHFIWYTSLFCLQVGFCHVLYCVSCSESYFYLCFFNKFCDCLYFFSDICKNCPFRFFWGGVLQTCVFALFVLFSMSYA
jgi:hypothetical protein